MALPVGVAGADAVEAGGDEEGVKGRAAGWVAGCRERAQRGAVVGALADDEVCARGLVGPEEILDGELEGCFYCF